MKRRSVLKGLPFAALGVSVPHMFGINEASANELLANQIITPEAALTIKAWRAVSTESRMQWEVCCRDGEPRGDEAEYRKWREIYAREQDALTAMLRAVSDDPSSIGGAHE